MSDTPTPIRAKRVDCLTTPVQSYLKIFCPACQSIHMPRIDGDNPWKWDGNTTHPTLSPSIRVTWPGSSRVCHSTISNGRITFISDSTHALSGQTVELPPLGRWEDL